MGGKKTLCYLMSVPAGEGSQEKKKGVPGGYFSIFYFQIFCVCRGHCKGVRSEDNLEC